MPYGSSAGATDAELASAVAGLVGSATSASDTFGEVEALLSGKASAASLSSHIANVSNPHAVTKTQVGLSAVDNTADASKPISTAQQAALDLKAALASPTFTGTVGGITKSMVGLGSVDNTADASKPVSTAQAAADSTVASNASSALSSHTANVANPHAVTATQVGLSNATNTSDANKPVSTAQQAALDLKAALASPTFTGTVGGITKSMVGLGSVDNTADTAKPVSTAQQTALNLKADLAGPTFTGTPAAPTAAAATNTTQLATTAFATAADAALISDTAYDATSWNGVIAVAPSKNAVRDQMELVRLKTIGIVIDGGAAVPSTGIKGYILFPVAGTIIGWRIIGDVTGSAVVDVQKIAYGATLPTASIAASAKPTLTSAKVNKDDTLTGWTTAITADDLFAFVLNSISTITKLTVELVVRV